MIIGFFILILNIRTNKQELYRSKLWAWWLDNL